MHEIRMLTLGGALRTLPVGSYQTDLYLRRVMAASFLVALTASMVVPIFFAHHDGTRPVDPPAGRIRDKAVWPSPPPSVVRSHGSMPRVRSFDHPLPIPVPDAEVEDPAADVFESAGSGNGDGTAIGAVDSGPFSTIGSTDGWAPPQRQAPEVFLFVEVPPELVSLTVPDYPELAREAGIEGVVHVQVLVGEDGFVLEALVLQGLPLLDEAALQAARSAVFRPAQQSGQPVRTRVVLPIEFSLRR